MNVTRKQLIFALWALGLGLFAGQAIQSPLLDSDLKKRQRLLDQTLQEHSVDYEEERALAEAYWNRNPDVEADLIQFGRHGPLGILGAREHYNIHGRREGRIWGLEK